MTFSAAFLGGRL